MTGSFLVSARSALTIGLVVTLSFAAAGCADMIKSGPGARDQGKRLYAEGNFTEAAGAFRNAVRQEPRDYKSYYYLGSSYAHMNAYEQAIQSYHSALKVMTVTLEGKEDKAFRPVVLDGLAQAIATAEKHSPELSVPDEGSTNPEDQFLRAKVFRYTGDADAAMQAYSQASNLDPKDFYVAKDYGLYLEQLGQQQNAAASLRRAYALNGKDEEVAAALRRIGIVPGPSLKNENDLAKPPVPKGPIPQVDWSKMNFGGQRSAPANPPPPMPAPEAEVPRD